MPWERWGERGNTDCWWPDAVTILMFFVIQIPSTSGITIESFWRLLITQFFSIKFLYFHHFHKFHDPILSEPISEWMYSTASFVGKSSSRTAWLWRIVKLQSWIVRDCTPTSPLRLSARGIDRDGPYSNKVGFVLLTECEGVFVMFCTLWVNWISVINRVPSLWVT